MQILIEMLQLCESVDVYRTIQQYNLLDFKQVLLLTIPVTWTLPVGNNQAGIVYVRKNNMLTH